VNYTYGKVRLGKGGIPVGGSDNAKAWPVFQAGENPVEIVGGTYRSGDASEYYGLAIVPPDFLANGTVTIDGGNQGVIILMSNLVGDVHTDEVPGDVYFNTPGKAYRGQNYIIPPFHQVVCWPNTAASTADFFVSLLGLDLIA